MIIELSPVVLGLIPVIIGVVQVIKTATGIDSRYTPLISLIFGVCGAFLVPVDTVAMTIIGGLIIGLSASGLYSGTKAAIIR